MPAVQRRSRALDSRGCVNGPAARRGGERVSEVQRARMLHSALRVLGELGYEQMSVARVTALARVSRRTFYDVFEDREDCFLAVFEDVAARATELVAGAYEREDGEWSARLRAALSALLRFLDEEPRMASLLVVDALRAGPRVLRRRAELLQRAGAALDAGGLSEGRSAGERSGALLTGEGVVGGVFSVIHTRLLARRRQPLGELESELTAMIVLPYRGGAAARRERRRPLRRAAHARGDRRAARRDGEDRAPARLEEDPLAGLGMRLTYRTLRVLEEIGRAPGASNRQVGKASDVADQGQISKLLARLERLGLIANAGGERTHGEPNAWRLTALGERVGVEVVLGGEASRYLPDSAGDGASEEARRV